jgi:hypothetical protein
VGIKSQGYLDAMSPKELTMFSSSDSKFLSCQ